MTLHTDETRSVVSAPRLSMSWCTAGSPDGLRLDTELFNRSAQSLRERPTARTAEEVRWQYYLDRLRHDGFEHGTVVDSVCKWVRDRLGGRWPAAVPNGDGVMLIWEFDARHVEIEIDADGAVEWFCKWRDSGRYRHGEPGRAWSLDSQLAAALAADTAP